MGNCQAVDAAALVIQHPCGKLERMYCPLTATDVMKTNPGHYVSLIIPLTLPDAAAGDHPTVRVKLLRPTDKLVLGRAYRLVTTQEVMKVLRAKKHAKMRRNMLESAHLQTSSNSESGQPGSDEGARQRQRPNTVGGGRPKSWRPSLQSISEAGSL